MRLIPLSFIAFVGNERIERQQGRSLEVGETCSLSTQGAGVTLGGVRGRWVAWGTNV